MGPSYRQTLSKHQTTSSRLLLLPSELFIRILELALFSGRVGVISALSKTIHGHVNEILYRTVVLDSQKAISLFHRTAKASAPALSRIRKLAVIWHSDDLEPLFDMHMGQEINYIISQCKHVHTLEVPVLSLVSTPDLSHHRDLVEVTTQYFEGRSLEGRLRSLQSRLTHLRLAEPPQYGRWVQPSTVLFEFGNPSQLTHLELSRRANANEENDALFVDDIVEILQGDTFQALRVLVISIFNIAFGWEPEPTQQSNIWQALERVAESDSRLVLVDAKVGAWMEEWKGMNFTVGTQSQFWRKYSAIPCIE